MNWLFDLVGVDFVIYSIKVAVVLVGMIVSVPVLVLAERKIIGRIQERPGPNRVGKYGSLQTIVDGIKLLLKEDLIPPAADRTIFILAPMMILVPAMLAITIIPFGPSFEMTIHGELRTINLGVTDLPVGILFYLAVTSVGVYGIVLAGWASNSKYSLLGGIRSTAQLISYELTLGLSLIGVLLIVGSFEMRTLVASQEGWFWNWHIFTQPVGFCLFLVAGFAETNRLPFDLPEGESELGAGFHTEYSSLKFAMFMMAEYMNILTFSAIVTTLFLGGFLAPFPIGDVAPLWAVLWGLLWFGLKVSGLFFFFVLVRGTLPRLRYDQLMSLGWKIMFPLAVLNIIVTAGIIALGVPRTGLWLCGAGVALILIVDRISTVMKRRVLGHAG